MILKLFFLDSNNLVSCLGPFFIDNSNYLLIILRKDSFLIFKGALSCKNPKGICLNLNCMFWNEFYHEIIFRLKKMILVK